MISVRFANKSFIIRFIVQERCWMLCQRSINKKKKLFESTFFWHTLCWYPHIIMYDTHVARMACTLRHWHRWRMVRFMSDGDFECFGSSLNTPLSIFHQCSNNVISYCFWPSTHWFHPQLLSQNISSALHFPFISTECHNWNW